jgi:hypothetical protein
MAKMFYTLDEAKGVLGKNEEEIKQYTREGRLREFRDGPRFMYKADQVEALKAELAGGDPVDLGASDSGAAIGLADSRGIGSGISSGLGSGMGSGIGSGATSPGSGIPSGIGSGVGSGLGSGLSGTGSGLSLVDTESGRSGSSAGGMSLKEDTALAADLGLSGSVGGVPSPAARAGGSGTGLSGSQGSRPGVDVFQNDEVERVDPSAQTAIAPGIADVPSEGVGSGSGLLDLTRESDDTSLGAELLDEIAPGGTASGRRGIPGETGVAPAAGTAAGKVVEIRGTLGGAQAARVTTVTMEEEPDPMSPAFGAAALGAALVALFGAYALISGVLETNADILQNAGKYGFIGVAAGGLAVTLVFFVVGLIIGKTTTK